MNIHLKFCGKCGEDYDYPECPYCRKETIKHFKEAMILLKNIDRQIKRGGGDVKKNK